MGDSAVVDEQPIDIHQYSRALRAAAPRIAIFSLIAAAAAIVFSVIHQSSSTYAASTTILAGDTLSTAPALIELDNRRATPCNRQLADEDDEGFVVRGESTRRRHRRPVAYGRRLLDRSKRERHHDHRKSTDARVPRRPEPTASRTP